MSEKWSFSLIKMPIHQRTSSVLLYFVSFVLEINPWLLFLLIWCAENKSICWILCVAFNQYLNFSCFRFVSCAHVCVCDLCHQKIFISLIMSKRKAVMFFDVFFHSSFVRFQIQYLKLLFLFSFWSIFCYARLSRVKWNMSFFAAARQLALNKRKSSEILCFSFIFGNVSFFFVDCPNACIERSISGDEFIFLFFFDYASE